MAIAQMFLQGFEQGRLIAQEQARQKLQKRQIEKEDRETSWQNLISEAYASTLAEDLAPASSPSPQPSSSLPAATPPSAMDAGAGVMPVAPPPATPTTATQALSMPGEAIQTAPTQPRPNPVAMSTDMPTPPQEQPERINFYKRIEEQQKTLLTAGVPMEKVLEFKEAVTKELSRRGMPHAQRAISLQKQAEQAMSAGNVQLAKKLSAMAARDVEEAYKYVPDNGFMKVGLAPNGMLAVQAYDDGLEPDPNKPPTLLSSQNLMDSLRVAFEPGAAFTVFEEQAAREAAKRKENREEKVTASTLKTNLARAQAAAANAKAALIQAAAAKARATTDAEQQKADKELRAAQKVKAEAEADLAKARGRLVGEQTRGAKITNDMAADNLGKPADHQHLLQLLPKNASPTQIKALGELIKTRLRPGSSGVVDYVDTNGDAYINGKRVPSALYARLKARSDAKGIPFARNDPNDLSGLVSQ